MAKKNLGKDGLAWLVCLTPISWIDGALPRNYLLERLHCHDDFFPRQEKRGNLFKFMIMDVIILNRCVVQASADGEDGGIICHGGGVHDPDAVRYYAPAYCNNDLLQYSNFKYRTLIAFLPNVHEPKWCANIDGTNTLTSNTIIGNQIVLIQKAWSPKQGKTTWDLKTRPKTICYTPRCRGKHL